MEFVLQSLTEYIPGQIWIQAYPIRYAGTSIFARMTVIRLADGRVWLHSPSEIDAETRARIDEIGPVAYIVAPGTFHHFWVQHAQALWPDAETFLCPGLERKRTDIDFDGIKRNHLLYHL